MLPDFDYGDAHMVCDTLEALSRYCERHPLPFNRKTLADAPETRARRTVHRVLAEHLDCVRAASPFSGEYERATLTRNRTRYVYALPPAR